MIKLGFQWQFGVVASFGDSGAIGPAIVVNFTDTSSNTPTSWSWSVVALTGGSSSFTNSTNSNSQNPQITFAAAGGSPDEFDVILEATNAAGTGTSAPTRIVCLP